ncbi:L-iditol 2-dehydrogenase [Anaerobacterium chartisolvens]|uniref:L-iditol 2-dehydrogenase n=1 Tax=Anaerobacterium chartisolvens TaxID=1297424 RepID=A0A369BI07_9FIRM|nr:alcohol dehydrogenase catalytic domain-containing protein [Anaerobacterium chartisolvens]RCX20087.1 L-iditol 2-dehydrogenase [Anaerobacterium chartisolvens]
MKQARLVETKKFIIEEADKPKANKGQAVVKILYCGICGSDLHVYIGHHPKVKAPVVLGHEAVGVVTQVSTGEERLKLGDRVAVVPLMGCGECEYCKLEQPNLCIDRKVIGFQTSGCLAEEVAIPVDNLIVLPDDCGDLQGALLEPAAVAVHSTGLLEKVRYSGKEVIITGAGTIGVLIGLLLKEVRGCNVTIVEINQDRINFAKGLGFKVINKITDFTGEEGARPVAFECTGNKAVFEMLRDIVPSPEVMVILGTFSREIETSIFQMCKYETFFIGSQMYTKKDLVEAAELMSTPLKEIFSKIVTDKIYKLEEVNEAYEEALNSKSGTKVIIKVS